MDINEKKIRTLLDVIFETPVDSEENWMAQRVLYFVLDGLYKSNFQAYTLHFANHKENATSPYTKEELLHQIGVLFSDDKTFQEKAVALRILIIFVSELIGEEDLKTIEYFNNLKIN